MAEVNALEILMLFAITIFVGYVGSLIFNKTKISDVIWLILFGILIGPVLHLVDRALFVTISPFLAAVALLIILFDAGLNMDFYQLVRGAPRSMLVGILDVLFGMLVVGFIATWFFGFDLLLGLLLGAILGGTSSAVVVAIVSRLNISQNVKTLLNLESIFTDPLVIVVSIALINIIVANSSYSALQGILAAFSVGAVIGVMLGIVWLFILEKLKGKPFDYMLTLAALLLVYVLVESAAGSGAIASLFFGIVLGNGATISRMLKIRRRTGANPMLRSFHMEVSFFIRSFFFVFLGIIVLINPTYIVYGLAIAASLIIIRLASIQIGTHGMFMSRTDKNLARVMAPRGLAAAVLAQLPVSAGIKEAAIFSDIIFVVILATVMYTTIASRLAIRRSRRPAKPDTEKHYKEAEASIKKQKG
ncbi:MAG: cation:proton antiporter [Candidatus Aenigmarchaeota archaeon]|nr:cation:proton antiporter [Candidatus Aenigmarchaeota archaeon]